MTRTEARMARRTLLAAIMAAGMAVGGAGIVRAADEPNRPANAGGVRGARGAGPAARLGARALAMETIQEPLAGTLVALGELNLTPDFELSKDQRQQIQAIRQEARAAMDKWREDHKDEIQKLAEDARDALRDADRQKARELAQRRQELLATAPRTDEATSKLKAVLAADQLRQLEDREAQMRAEAGRLRQELRAGAGGARGARAGRRGGQ